MKITKLKDMRVGEKLLVSYGVIILLYIVTIVVALFGIFTVSSALDTFYVEAFNANKAAGDMKTSLQGIGRGILNIAIGTSEEAREIKYAEIDELIALVNTGLPVLEAQISDEAMMEELTAGLEVLFPIRDEAIRLLRMEKYDEALEYYDSKYEPVAGEVRNCLKKIGNYTSQLASDCLADGHRIKRQMVMGLAVLSIIICTISTVLWLRITRGITRPIAEIKAATRQLSEGNLDTAVAYESEDELGELADSFRKTVEVLKLYISEMEKGLLAIGNGKLNDCASTAYRGDFVAIGDAMEQITRLLNNALLQIANTADQVANSAVQVAGNAQILSLGATDQAGSMEELAANIDEISASVRNNADDAVGASRKVEEVSHKVEESSSQMKAMVKAITEIRENSKVIGDIVKEVEDIAFQTNILALNASVEAARAGEAGRGFSVVANEVRHLAAKTREASHMMAQLAEQTTEKVNGGTKAADRTAKALELVVGGTEEINQIVDRISEASVHQADAIIQIRQSIEQVSEIVQGNSAAAEEGAAASEELSAQAQVMKKLVEEFELS